MRSSLSVVLLLALAPACATGSRLTCKAGEHEENGNCVPDDAGADSGVDTDGGDDTGVDTGVDTGPDTGQDSEDSDTQQDSDTATDTGEVYGLEVEIEWAVAGDDLDLHLVRNHGALTSTDDCYYGNCTSGLDWGSSSSTDDDPTLALDDIPGTGPELIALHDPAEDSYTAYVHDYPGTVNTDSNTVTMTVRFEGVEVWTGTLEITEEDEYYAMAEIDWLGGVVTAAP